MGDWEIRQDLERRYLVTAVKGMQEDYRIQMLVHQTTEQLLPCTTRRVNGELLLTYDISGKQSLAQLCTVQSAGIGLLRLLFGTVYLCLQQMKDYLLQAEMLLLSPDTVFCDAGGAQFYLCCMPDADNGGFAGLYRLSAFLLEVLDHTDAEAVQFGYALYRSCLPGKLQQEEIMRLLRGCTQKMTGTEADTAGLGTRKTAAVKEPIKQLRPEQLLGQTVAGGHMPVYEQESGKLEEPQKKAGRAEQNRRQKNAADMEVIPASEVHMPVMPAGGWTLPQSVQPIVKKKQKRKEQRKKEQRQKEQRQKEQRERQQTHTPLSAYAAEKLFAYGEKSCMLQGMEKGLATFSPAGFPFLIGSLEFAVDGYIDDVTVSRFHARLEKKEDGYYLTDLDSAHGTKRNGSLLVPQTETRLENGDEICFGRTVFRITF